jgi:diguanylate cyclase (GGDEF)-like protein
MGWLLAGTFNLLIAVCYVMISSLILAGLIRTRQLTSNPLAVATATIFLTCAVHHGHHGLHLLMPIGGAGAQAGAVRAAFGEWHSVAIDAVGLAVALAYLGLRRSYGNLLNTPSMFDDAVRVETERRLREAAYTDQLTALPNRAAYQQLADSLPAGDLRLAVLLLDLDGFKAINDLHGHEAGDRVLQHVAQTVTAGLLPGEHAFRLGGDEFVLIGVGHDAVAAAEFAARVSARVSTPVAVRGGSLVATASLGVATGIASDGVDRLLREADVAMYEQKRQAHRELPRPRPAARVKAAPLTAATGPSPHPAH